MANWRFPERKLLVLGLASRIRSVLGKEHGRNTTATNANDIMRPDTTSQNETKHGTTSSNPP
jgi:hypothetical protein